MPAERDRTIDALTAAFAAGDLSMEEFEARVAIANRSDDSVQLRRLLADLPREFQQAPVGFTTTGSVASRDWKQYAQEYKDRYRHADRKADQVAIFSSSRRVGRWTLTKQLDSVAIFGSCLIDLRQADIPPVGGRIEAVGLFGSVQILVPPGLNVRVSGVSIFGSATGSGDIIGDSDAPWVEIEGVAIFGSVEVKVVS
ncbi:DUF1707 SHOCT-like domain-containing protein [Gracilinema caldarium]|uniref:Uncharacterized protein n=1 Tax=Gracilinema caldarium (strain ATCC 51460 / DSM 7334 / H1) TaxID=744872 RepID=F8F224_GRAC1|nr:DUF1707 domain-containing protein [Gracilinema caldarium]AEJ20296.1 protein of unknown function DUF1707 [Gracilinema caldarium DSM 7334]